MLPTICSEFSLTEGENGKFEEKKVSSEITCVFYLFESILFSFSGRYQSIRRTITGRAEQDDNTAPSGSLVTTIRRTQADIEHHSNPGMAFLARSDFPMVVRSNQVDFSAISSSSIRIFIAEIF